MKISSARLYSIFALTPALYYTLPASYGLKSIHDSSAKDTALTQNTQKTENSVNCRELESFLNSHYSARHFTNHPVSDDILARIIQMARRSPTSSNLQMCSIVSVRDVETKANLAKLCGSQRHIETCQVFLAFLADLYPHSELCKERGYPFKGEYLEPFLLATVDAALCAGRALIAAQALGYGGVLVGGIRNEPEKVAATLALPDYCYAVCGMSLGKPDGPGKVRPRISDEGFHHRERYDRDRFRRPFAEYDELVKSLGWYENRRAPLPEGVSAKTSDENYSWSEHTARRLSADDPGALRLSLKPFLEKIGFRLK